MLSSTAKKGLTRKPVLPRDRLQRPAAARWDLAKATGQDTTMPEGLPEAAYEMIHGRFTDEQRKVSSNPKSRSRRTPPHRRNCSRTQAATIGLRIPRTAFVPRRDRPRGNDAVEDERVGCTNFGRFLGRATRHCPSRGSANGTISSNFPVPERPSKGLGAPEVRAHLFHVQFGWRFVPQHELHRDLICLPAGAHVGERCRGWRGGTRTSRGSVPRDAGAPHPTPGGQHPRRDRVDANRFADMHGPNGRPQVGFEVDSRAQVGPLCLAVLAIITKVARRLLRG